jgi:hypothetical protein
MEILSKILGSGARVKIMRLFLQNRSKGFTVVVVSKHSRVSLAVVHRELRLLSSVGFIKKRTSASKEWFFNSSFKYAREFEDLLIRSDNLNKQTVLDNFKNVGKVKLIIVSGAFIKLNDSRVDLLIVGDKIKKGGVEEGVRKLEALLGAELTYAVFDTKEFIYRLEMYDKLVRDILDYPNEVLFQAKELAISLNLKKF